MFNDSVYTHTCILYLCQAVKFQKGVLCFFVYKPNRKQKKKTIYPTMTCNVNLIEKPI